MEPYDLPLEGETRTKNSNEDGMATLANGIVFEWCDDSIGTMEEMLSWPLQGMVDLTNASMCESDQISRKDRSEKHMRECELDVGPKISRPTRLDFTYPHGGRC